MRARTKSVRSRSNWVRNRTPSVKRRTLSVRDHSKSVKHRTLFVRDRMKSVGLGCLWHTDDTDLDGWARFFFSRWRGINESVTYPKQRQLVAVTYQERLFAGLFY